MKKTYIFTKILLVGLFLVIVNQSCTDLEEEVFSEVTADNFFTTDEENIAALGAAYTGLQNFFNEPFALHEISSDEMVVPTRGADWFDNGNWQRIHLHTYQAGDDRVGGTWGVLYGGINTCNRLIFQFEELNDPSLVPFIGELKILRAFFYWQALDLYGNVPLVDRFDLPEGFVSSNGTGGGPLGSQRKLIYDFVESEVLANIDGVTATIGGEAYGRMNKWTAHAILAKLYMNAEAYTGTPQWTKAMTHLDAIIGAGYSLESNYFDNFAVANEGSAENIFVIPFDEVFAPEFNLVARTLHYGSQGTFNTTFQPWNGYSTVEDFYNSYDDADLRKVGTAGRAYGNFIVGPQFNTDGTPVVDPGADADDPDGPNLNFTPAINELGPNAYRQAGARIGKYEFEIGGTNNMNNDYVVFRLADFMLLKAEVLVRQGDVAGALPLVNAIRDRAGMPAYAMADLTMDELLAERGREMYAEATRRQDLIRFGKYNDAWWAKPADPSTDVNIFPIPTSQLNANAQLKQNDGY